MLQAWRWFGPNDPVPLDDIRQAGATHIVTALHQYAPGEAWPRTAVAERRRLIEAAPKGRTPLRWSVVESIPVADDIKRLGAAAKKNIAVWIASMEAVAAEGIKTICYNFMPIVDWTRTDLRYEMPNGARALRFDYDRFAAFDLFILKRPCAEASYDAARRQRAKRLYNGMPDGEAAALAQTICAGLPGATSDALDLPAFAERIAAYKGVDASKLRQHLVEFLQAVTPAAAALGVRLTLHPDDPPRPLFGLPRIASSAEDYKALFDAVPSAANGMCYCTGSLGASPANDLVAIAKRFAPRIHFAHLRSTRREADLETFHEADHLEGDFDMIAVLRALLAEDGKRNAAGKIPFRPDHGHLMLDDLTKHTNPGYSAIGRLRGLAELRGAIRALESEA